MASELTAEADWKRRGLYIGPQFPTLDDGLQEQFQAFLDERGINDDLAMFIPMFAEYKEQKGKCDGFCSSRKSQIGQSMLTPLFLRLLIRHQNTALGSRTFTSGFRLDFVRNLGTHH